MDIDTLKIKIVEILNSSGINVFNDDYIDVSSITSIAFVNVIIAIEDEFQITFPDRYMEISVFETISGLSRIIYGEINNRTAV